ncbi:glycoside hydrolase family 88 protein [Cerasicoccus arenae]|uniref:Uncharacterized protein n=1 Tax=Cerasicoccus arenae TaxID=424488 RepID=A0A8J3GCR5_9BACT|nr:glycoside hydrolase family 88 protein [Cerasicoccus arenae]MBK1858271.1 glycoside hydrolase family 88 protein [Cerasicoccus arenae]GHB90434.1 hypothetical protein GCM10007047_01470 [Cerasicoccus arenae]
MLTAQLINTTVATPKQALLANLDAVRIEPGNVLRCLGGGGKIISLAVAADLRGDCVVTFVDGRGQEQSVAASYASHAQRIRLLMPTGGDELRVSKVTGEAELWIATQAPLAPITIDPDADLPTRRQHAFTRLQTDAVCQFSWMGGCVLDGLAQLQRAAPHAGWAVAIDAWLAHFFQGDELVYQNPRGQEVHNAFHGVESTLPVSVLAARDPYCPATDWALANWRADTRADGLIADHCVTAEGNYTVAYPLAVIGAGRGDTALIESALTQLRARRNELCIDGDLYLRNREGALSFRNWTRGICWYLLGLTRCLETLGVDSDAALAAHAAERGQWIISRQRSDGLWDNFLDEAGQGFPPDSSGSSGIATALMALHQLGLLGDEALASAERCWDGLGNCLEPDGWLGSVAPNNKRGEAEQHTHRRTIEPFALGLYGQLAAALKEF